MFSLKIIIFSLQFFFFLFVHVNSENKVIINENYQLEWSVDREADQIIFEVTVRTKGFIGFGISHNGAMKDADIITTGIDNYGRPYIHDRHGIGEMVPPADIKQDYKLIDGYENNTHTYIKFWRILNTCDDEDIPITSDSTKIIWSFGQTDQIAYHGTNRGAYAVSLLDGVPPEQDLSPYKVWTVPSEILMPSDDTTYRCTFHKAPLLDTKHHIIGFDAYLTNELAKTHTHHIDFYKCVPPQGVDPDEFFGEYMESEGFDCNNPNFTIRWYCDKFEYSYAIGGLLTMLPENVGIPIGILDHTEYYMMEIHYDNPHEYSGLKFTTGLSIYFTDHLRNFDGGFMVIGHSTSYSLMLPPNSTNIIISGHCSPECTKQIPPDGLNIFRVLLHAHTSGRKMKMRHFRGNEELPWLVNDNHYNFEYQQNKPISPEIKALQGDAFTVECTYDSTWKNNKATIGGFSTREEMCFAFALYYPLFEPLNYCISHFPKQKILEYFGIEKIQDDDGFPKDPIIEEPESLKGLTLTQVIERATWNDEKREEYQTMIRNSLHTPVCAPMNPNIPDLTYPDFDKEYAPIDECAI